MTEEGKILLNKYQKKKDKNIILDILKIHGFKFNSDYNVKDLELYKGENIIQVIASDSSYDITFEDDCVITNHVYDDYTIKKTYLYENLNDPVSKTITITINNKELICYSESIVLNEIKNVYERVRTLEKTGYLKGQETIIFSKTFKNEIKNPNKCSTTTKINNIDCYHQIDIYNLKNALSCSSVKYNRTDIVHTNFYNDKTENINDNLFSKKLSVSKSNIVITIKNDESNVEVKINKNGYLINIESKDESRKPQSKSIYGTNIENNFSTDDINLIIEFFDIVKENPIITEELKEIKYILLRNTIYQNGIKDEIDIYFEEHKINSFEETALDLCCNKDTFNEVIDKISGMLSENVQEELKKSSNKLF